MAGGIDWFRWHHGSVTDPKFQLVAKKAGASLPDVLAVWAYLLEQASASEKRGEFSIDAEAVDCMFGFPSTETRTADIVAAMAARGLLDDSRIASWEKRQPKRERLDDSSAERTRDYRAKQRQATPSNANAAQVTPCDATSRQETPREEKSREEEKEENTQTETPGATAAGAVCVLLRSKRIATVNPGHIELAALLEAGTDIGAFAAAADIAIQKGHPSFAYVLGIVKRQAEEARRIAAEGLAAPPPAKSAGPPLTVPSTAAERTAAEQALQAEHAAKATKPPAEVLARLAQVTQQIKSAA